jgi:LmbE family N-acetylglucosaminyl deacetylase
MTPPSVSRILIAMSLAVSISATAAPPRQPNGAELARAVERLSVVGSVLYVAAHPDDENTRLLAWLVNEKLVRAGYLSLTRGEGGQNLIGAEQAPLLGVIRTEELLAARGVDGAEQYFTRARDFGYSKTPEETLAIWDRDAVLADLVWAIRRFRPDVIVTRFPPDGRDTHGHHTASAQLAVEAFHAAADPTFHPEQLALAAPWQAKRIVWNKGLFNAPPNEDLSGFLKLDVSGYNPVLGASYGELAATSRSMHKSQGFGAAPARGPAPEYFKVLAGAPAEHSIFDGIDMTWARIKGADKVAEALRRARTQLNPAQPAASIPALVEAAAALDALPPASGVSALAASDDPWRTQKRAELDRAIAACAGLWTEAFAADFVAVPGGESKVTAVALNRSSAPLTLRAIRFHIGAAAPIEQRVDAPLAANQPFQVERALALPADLPLSNPHWLVDPPEPGHFNVRDPALIHLPEPPPPLSVDFELASGAHVFTVTRPVSFKWTDPVAGERYRPIEILPEVTLNPAAPLLMFPDGQPKELRVTVQAQARAASGEVRPEAPAGWTLEPASISFALKEKGEQQVLTFHAHPPAHLPKDAASLAATVKLVATAGAGAPGTRGVLRLEYPHIPIQTILPPAEVKLVRFELAGARAHLGYLPGPGDEVAASLRQVGYDVTVLSDEALGREPLGRFAAIVVGVRAFNTNPRLAQYHKRLMDYVAAGGRLIAQYNTNNRISKIAGELGPYPFSISQDRVTDENAPVEWADPAPAILRAPNRITARDFAGWVQERGLYFADKWDEHYETPLSLHDPGEPARKGALLIARFGKGTFIYTGLAFFRQLPAGVPGAYRLFANLLAHP